MKRLGAVITAGILVLLGACATAAPAPAAAPARATSQGGIVIGTLQLEGGPIGPDGQQPGSRPIPGTIQFTVGGQRPVTVRAGTAGTFSVKLPAGIYAVSGRSPRVIEMSGGTSRQDPCSQPLSVTVTARHTSTIALTCIVP
jgi:hypothetical protein